jgi:hypothetical protein
MDKIELAKRNLVEFNSTKLQKIDGGYIWGALGLYLLWETAGNPSSSWNSFMAGWKAAN